MAPVFSKMPSSSVQSTARQQSLAIPTRSTTITELTDDSLLLLLSLLPLSHLLRQVHLSCKRWHTLLPYVLRQRRSLLLHEPLNASYQRYNSFFQRFQQRITPYLYAAYVDALINFSKVTSAKWNHLKATFNLSDRVEGGDLPRVKFTVNSPPPSRPLAAHLPNLTHLSLFNIFLPLEDLLHLLSTYRNRLHSLSLKHVWLFGPISFQMPKCSPFYGTPFPLETFFEQLLPLLDSMTGLRRLALGFSNQTYKTIDLPTLLSRLEVFTLASYAGNPLPILEQLNGEKLKQLHLYDSYGWYQVSTPLTSLFTSEVSSGSFGSALTHLTLINESMAPWSQGVTLPLLQAIVTRCSRLRHLSMSTENSIPFISLLSHLVKLPRLSSLELQSKNSNFFDVSPETLRSGAFPILACLGRLSLEITINPKTFTILPSVCPNLRQLFLDKAEVQLEQGYIFIDTTDSILLQCLNVSPQMDQLIGVLNSFAFLPKINSILEMKANGKVPEASI